MTSISLRKQLQTILEEKLIPAARSDAPLILLAPPVNAVSHPGVNVTSTSAAPLPRAKACRSHIALHYWPEQSLNSLRVPYLACVFDGEADIVTGLTEEEAKRSFGARGKKPLACGRQTVSISGPGFFLVPPGAPVSYGPRPHWERPEEHAAYSRIFWIHLVPAGAFCHTCSSSKGRHQTHPFVFVADDELAALSQLLLSEMMRRQERQEDLAHALLHSLLLKLRVAFYREKSQVLSTGEVIESVAALPGGLAPREAVEKPQEHRVSLPVRRALNYLEANLNEPLDPTSIAARGYVSSSHLNRLFQAELGASVMEYVTRQRLKKARALLLETDLPIAEVALHCGYSNACYFTQLFTRSELCSPRAFRQANKTELSDTNILSPR